MKFKLCFIKIVPVAFSKKKKSFAHLVEKWIAYTVHYTVQVLPILSWDKVFLLPIQNLVLLVTVLLLQLLKLLNGCQ